VAGNGRGLAERPVSRLIKVFDNLSDTSPTVFADLRIDWCSREAADRRPELVLGLG
jgi:hypothetical protein